MKPAVFGLLDSTATRPDPPARNWEKELVQEMRVVKMCWAITGSCCNSSSLTVRVQIKWFLDLYICNTYIISFYDTLAGSILFLNLYDQTLRISGERHCCNILQLLFPCVVFLPSFGREAPVVFICESPCQQHFVLCDNPLFLLSSAWPCI